MDKIEREATEFLKEHGLTWAGQPKGKVDPGQYWFERRIISTPAGGQPRKPTSRPSPA